MTGMESDFDPRDPHENTVRLLRQVQADYRQAREQLLDVSSRFGEREALASRRLHEAVSSLTGGAGADDAQAGSGAAAEKASPDLEVYCLGTFRVRVRSALIEHWSSNKARSVLKYLVANRGRAVTRDSLMEALWPDSDPILANNNLKAAIRSLRQTLAKDCDPEFPWIVFQDGSYTIHADAQLWTDTEQFEFHWRTAREMEKAGRLPEAMAHHQVAVAFYRGDYLQDDPYEEWTTLRRESLKDIYLAILGRLADHSMSGGDYESCIVYCQRILEKDSCREDAYRRLMRGYCRLGNRNRAIAWYRLCERTVRAELDVAPDHETKALYQSLLRDEAI